MRYFKSRLEEARRSAEHTQARIKGAAVMDVVTGGGSALTSIDSQGRQAASNARDQQRHYRGQSYISIRKIADRIAGQPIRLARIGKPKSKGKRAIEPCHYALPKWVERLAQKGYGTNETGGLEVIDQHPILDALDNPEAIIPGWLSWHLKSNTVAELELAGDAYWWLPQVKGKRQVWYLPSSWVKPVNSPKQLFIGYDIQPEGSAEPKFVPREEVARFFYPDPAHPFVGLGPFEAGAQEVMVNEFVVESQKRTFQQGPHPSCIVRVGKGQDSQGRERRGRLREYQREQVRQAINRNIRGMLHFGEALILDGRIESFEPYGNDPKSMDYGTNADSARARVEQLYGVNPYTSGAAGLGSRAEAATADEQFCYVTVNPKIELLSGVLTTCVLPIFDSSGMYVLFIEPARPRDAEMEQKEWDMAVQNSMVTANEFRTMVLRLPPTEWGDAVVVKNGYSVVPVDQLKDGYTVTKDSGPTDAEVDSDANKPAPPADGAKPKPEEKPSDDEGDDEGKDGKQLLLTHQKVYDDLFLDKYVETWLKLHESHETNIAPAVEKFLKEQGEKVAAKLEDNYGNLSSTDVQTKITAFSASETAFNPQDWVDDFKDALRPALAYALVAGATHELAAFGDGTALKPPEDAPASLSLVGKEANFDISYEFGVDLPQGMLHAINTALDAALAKDYWAEIQDTTRDRLQTALHDGIEAGEDMRSIVKRVKDDVFEGEAATARAKNIARTETTHLMNAGQDAARQELHEEGLISGKEWFATFDGKTRESHYSANGQVKGVNEPFTVGGYSAKYPGDPDLPAKERCNCRCVASSTTVFTKHTRAPLVKIKGILARGCEIHG